METVKVKTTIRHDGRLKIDVPSRLIGDVEVMLIIESKPSVKATYDFSDLAGKLSVKIDPLKYQTDIRNEW
jgi:hypothetical protein